MESVFATKLLSHGVPSLFHLLSCCVNSLTKGTDIGADGEPLVIVAAERPKEVSSNTIRI